MPMFDFTCTCGHKFEKIVKLGVIETECPKCRSTVKKDEIQRNSNFQLTGSGWYKTDFKR